jgi:hypothetical protein
LRRIASGSSADRKLESEVNDSTAGLLAEFHVEKGIDDRALVERLKAIGFKVVWHKRLPECRFAFTRRLVAGLGDVTAFELLLQKPPAI